MPVGTIIEGSAWFLSMLAVSLLSMLMSRRLNGAIAEKAAMPKINAQEGSRLFFIFGINYLLVAIASTILLFTQGPQLATEIYNVMREWWLVEVFIFLNIITSYCLYTALRRVVVNI